MAVAKVEIQYLENGELKKAIVHIRTLTVEEAIMFASRNPFGWNWLLTGGGEGMPANAAADVVALAWNHVEKIEVEGQEVEAKRENFPDFFTVLLVAHFKNLNFLCQGDVDFFENMQKLISSSGGLQN